jgi:hypothetical protein
VLFVGFFSREKQPHVLFDACCSSAARLASTLVFVGAKKSAYFESTVDWPTPCAPAAQQRECRTVLVFADPTPRIDDYYRRRTCSRCPRVAKASSRAA